MQYFAIVLMVVCALCMAGHSTVQTHLLKKADGFGPKEAVFIGASGAALWVFPIIYIDRHLFQIEYIWNAFFGGLVGLIFVNCFIQYLNAKSRELGGAAMTAPIQGITPGLVTGAAIVLGEMPGVQGWAGVVLIGLGTWSISIKNATKWTDYFIPVRGLWRPSNYSSLGIEDRRKADADVRVYRLSYGSAVLGTFGIICDGVVSRTGPIGLGFAIFFVSLALVFGLTLLMTKPERTGAFMSRIKANLPAVVATGFFWGAATASFAVAFRLAPVAYVGSLKRLAVITTVLVAMWVLREKNAKLFVIPALLITAGAMLLALDPSSGIMVKASYALIESLR